MDEYENVMFNAASSQRISNYPWVQRLCHTVTQNQNRTTYLSVYYLIPRILLIDIRSNYWFNTLENTSGRTSVRYTTRGS